MNAPARFPSVYLQFDGAESTLFLLRNLQPGKVVHYHEGYLPNDRSDQEVDEVASLAYELGRGYAKNGVKVTPRAYLFQHRTGFHRYKYFALGASPAKSAA